MLLVSLSHVLNFDWLDKNGSCGRLDASDQILQKDKSHRKAIKMFQFRSYCKGIFDVRVNHLVLLCVVACC